MHEGAGLKSRRDSEYTAAIWGSDRGLVFLLHNQFTVWIPLHITLNIHLSLDPLKSLFASPHFALFQLRFTLLFDSPSENSNLCRSTNMKHNRKMPFFNFILLPSSPGFPFLLSNSLPCHFTVPPQIVHRLHFLAKLGTLRVIIQACVCSHWCAINHVEGQTIPAFNPNCGNHLNYSSGGHNRGSPINNILHVGSEHRLLL